MIEARYSGSLRQSRNQVPYGSNQRIRSENGFVAIGSSVALAGDKRKFLKKPMSEASPEKPKACLRVTQESSCSSFPSFFLEEPKSGDGCNRSPRSAVRVLSDLRASSSTEESLGRNCGTQRTRNQPKLIRAAYSYNRPKTLG